MRLESGKYRAFARYRRWDGRLTTITATGATEPAARRLLEERIVSQLHIERALEGVDAASPFGDVAEAWLVELSTGATPAAFLTLEHVLRQYVLPTFQQTPFNKMTADGVERFLAPALMISPDRHRFTSGVLDQVMDFAVRNAIVSANPMIAASGNPWLVPDDGSAPRVWRGAEQAGSDVRLTRNE